MFLTAFGAILVIIFIWYCYWFIKVKSVKNGLYAPFPAPIVGPAFSCPDPSNIWSMYDLFKKFKENFTTIILNQRIIGLMDRKPIDFVINCSQTLRKSLQYDAYKKWLGTGILLSNGTKWQKRRKMINPSFHFKLLENYICVFNSNADILVQQFNKEVHKESTDICPYIVLHTLDIICECAMGTTINAQTNADSKYVKSVKEICRICIKKAISLQLYPIVFWFSGNYGKETKSLKVLHEFTRNVIKSRRELLKNSKHLINDGTRKVFIDLLLESTIDGIPLTDEDIREEVDTLMFAGHDTTSSALSFTLFCIATHPEIQAKIIEEQISIYDNDKNQDCTTTDLNSMKYLELVIKETLRLYPPVPFIGREAIGDIKYDDNITFEKYDQICLFIFGLHRDPKYYPEPEKFIPERFSPEIREGKEPLPYLPFSAGPRNCIGQRFAMLELKATISKVIRSYELFPVVPAHKPLLINETILKSENGLLIRLKKREYM